MTMGPRRVFVDTGAWYALQVSDDEWHEAAAATLSGLVASRHTLVTTNQIVGETYTLLRMTCGHAAALAFLDRLEESRRVERIFVGKEPEARAYRLLRQYADQDFSFVDATSFVVMRSERTPRLRPGSALRHRRLHPHPCRPASRADVRRPDATRDAGHHLNRGVGAPYLRHAHLVERHGPRVSRPSGTRGTWGRSGRVAGRQGARTGRQQALRIGAAQLCRAGIVRAPSAG